MKKILIYLIFISSMSIPINIFAIEYIWKDDQGNRYFDCGGFVVGGEAVVKEVGRELYRVRGVLIDRQIKATSIFHAAQIACGEREEVTEKKQVEKPE